MLAIIAAASGWVVVMFMAIDRIAAIAALKQELKDHMALVSLRHAENVGHFEELSADTAELLRDVRRINGTVAEHRVEIANLKSRRRPTRD